MFDGLRQQAIRDGRALMLRLARALTPGEPRPRFYYDRAYGQSLSGVPLDFLRSDRILAFLAVERLITKDDLRRPELATLEQIGRVHGFEYLESLRTTDALAKILGLPISDDARDSAIALQRHMVGGTIAAVRAAVEKGRVGVNLGGGFHHARPNEGRGFCVFNDIAVAIHELRNRGYKGRILVVDLDLHDGDGTRLCFADDPTVHAFSIHNQTWDMRPTVESTVIELGPKVEDAQYLAALTGALPTVLRAFAPSLVIYLAGTDPAKTDLLGNWNITAEGLLERDRFVLETVRGGPNPLPMAVVLGGGYGVDAWRYSSRFFSLLLTGRVIEPPTTEQTTVAIFRSMSTLLPGGGSSLTSDGPGATGDGDSWALTEEDITGGFAASPTQTHRFLGYYTPHGLELALEHYGFFRHLRSLGYPHPVLKLDTREADTHLMRIFGNKDETDLLVELRVHRDRRMVPGLELLHVDWLLLQNPREKFSERRRKLPGQQHPGLGLLDQVCGLLVLACDRLGLDGVVFVPAHYHLAAVSRHIVSFLHPTDEARFRALVAATQGRGVAEATWLVENGRIVREATGEPVRWAPTPMVMAVSAALSARLAPEVFEPAVEQAARELGPLRVLLDSPT